MTMIKVTVQRLPPSVTLFLPNREPYIIRDITVLLALTVDLSNAVRALELQQRATYRLAQ